MRTPIVLLLPLLVVPSAAAGVDERALPTGWKGPSNLAFDEAGLLWLTLEGSWALGRLDAATGQGALFPLAAPRAEEGDALWALRLGKDGTVWTGSQTHLHRVDAASGNATAFKLPVSTIIPGDIFLAANGRVWYALVDQNLLLELDPATRTFTPHELPESTGPLDFHETPAGEVHVSLTYAGAFARFDPSTGNIELAPTRVESPVGLARDDDGALWVAEMGASRVSRAFPTTGNATARYPTTPSPYYSVSGPSGILVAPDGSVWFVEHFADRVARLDVANRTLHEYEMPSAPGTNVQRIARAPDGAMWLAELSTHKLARATFTGEPLAVTVPTEVNVTAGSQVDITIASSAPLKLGSPHENLTVQEGPGKLTLRPAASLPAGDYLVLVATTSGKTTVGQYMTVHVAPAAKGTPGVTVALILGVTAMAALLTRRS